MHSGIETLTVVSYRVSMITGQLDYRMDDPGTGFGTQKAASYPVGTGVPLPGDKSSQVVKVITDQYLVSRLRRRGTVPPLPYVLTITAMLYRREKNH